VDFHRKYVHPANMIAAVSGSFSKAVMIQKLEAAFASWPGTAATVPPVPSEIQTAAPGIYRIQKDVNQGRVSIGLPSVRRDDPDAYALEVMNEILGGSGFTSRITKTVRSDEGLAYSAGSGLRFGIYYPGAFRAEFQSKSRSVSYAASLVLQEIKGMREKPVTAEELDTIKRNLIETFPSTFNSKAQTVAIFAAGRIHEARSVLLADLPGPHQRRAPRPTSSASPRSTWCRRSWSSSWSGTRRRSTSGTASTRRAWRRWPRVGRSWCCHCAIR
jgi:zinc protease